MMRKLLIRHHFSLLETESVCCVECVCSRGSWTRSISWGHLQTHQIQGWLAEGCVQKLWFATGRPWAMNPAGVSGSLGCFPDFNSRTLQLQGGEGGVRRIPRSRLDPRWGQTAPVCRLQLGFLGWRKLLRCLSAPTGLMWRTAGWWQVVMQRGVFPFCLEATSQAVVGEEGEALLHRLPPFEFFLFISPSLSLCVHVAVVSVFWLHTSVGDDDELQRCGLRLQAWTRWRAVTRLPQLSRLLLH